MPSNELKVIVGAGSTFQLGWKSLTQDELDLLDSAGWARTFTPSSVDVLLAEHVWEHLTLAEGLKAALNCHRYLKRGGYMRVAVPDGLHPEPNYIDWVRPGGIWNPDDHKVLYTYKTLGDVFTQAGFKVLLLEWFDEQGRLNVGKWSMQDGNIMRSAKHWYAHTFLSLVVKAPYTSLIIDAYKE